MILRNATWLLLGRTFGDGLSFIFYVCLARAYGEAAMGEWAFAFALAGIASIAVEFGIRNLLTRIVARDPAEAARKAGPLVVTQALVAGLMGIGLVILVNAADYSPALRWLVGGAFAALSLKVMGMTFVGCLDAVDAMGRSALIDVSARITIVALGLALIFSGASLPVVMLSQVAGGAVYLAMAASWTRKRFGALSVRPRLAMLRVVVPMALPFACNGALHLLNSRIDVVMLLHLAGERATGAYGVALRCLDPLLLVSMSAGFALYPSLARGLANPDGAPARLIADGLRWLALAGALGALLLVTVGDEVIVLVFGEEFRDAGELLRWMAALYLLRSLAVGYFRFLLATDRERLQLSIQAVAVTVNVALNIVLIPRFGAHGAIWASIASEAMMVIAFHVACARSLPKGLIGVAARIALISTAAAGLGLFLRAVAPWPATALAVVAVLAVGSGALGVLDRQDLRRVTRVFRRGAPPCPAERSSEA